MYASVDGATLFLHFASDEVRQELQRKLEEHTNLTIFGPSGENLLGEQGEKIVCGMTVDGLDRTVPAFDKLMSNAGVRIIAYSDTDTFCLYSDHTKEATI